MVKNPIVFLLFSRYIPPNTEIVIRINFRDHFYMRINNVNIKDSEYFSNEAVAADIVKFRFMIKDFKINFERYSPSDKNFSASFANTSCKIPFDSPNILSFQYNTGSAHQQFKVNLEHGTKALFIFFSHAHK